MKTKFDYNDFLILEKDDLPKSPQETGIKFYVFSPKSRANIVTLNSTKYGQEYKEMHVNFITDKKLTHSVDISPNQNSKLFDNLDFESIFKNWIVFDYLIRNKPTLEASKFHKAIILQIKDNLSKLFEGNKAPYKAEEVIGNEKFKKAVKDCKEYAMQEQEKRFQNKDLKSEDENK